MSETPSAPCGVGGFGFVPIAIDHHKIPDELRGDVARLLDRLGIANAYIDALEARVAELEAENKSLRDRFSDADTERNAAQGGLKAAFARVAELEARCKRLEEAGDAMADWNMTAPNLGCDPELLRKWQQAKEAKP